MSDDICGCEESLRLRAEVERLRGALEDTPENVRAVVAVMRTFALAGNRENETDSYIAASVLAALRDRAIAEAPGAEMHPCGRCTCVGEGTCDWCVMTEAKLVAEAVPAPRPDDWECRCEYAPEGHGQCVLRAGHDGEHMSGPVAPAPRPAEGAPTFAEFVRENFSQEMQSEVEHELRAAIPAPAASPTPLRAGVRFISKHKRGGSVAGEIVMLTGYIGQSWWSARSELDDSILGIDVTDTSLWERLPDEGRGE